MAKNDLILLDGILEEYQTQGLPSNDIGEVFEFFATSQILKEYAFKNSEILSGSVDGRNDGGIDEFFIIVNGHLAENIPDDFWPKASSELEVYIITCKHDDSFKQAPINTLIPSLSQLLDFTIPSKDLESSYNSKVLTKRDLFYKAYRKLSTSLEKFRINIIYACRGTEDIENNVQAKADQAENICRDNFSECSVEFSFWGNTKLLEIYRQRNPSKLDLKIEKALNQNNQYIVLSNISKYCEFITAPNGKLNKYLFDSNVRDYLGLNPVNQDILNSLENNHQANFWWLNNGITLICSHAQSVGDIITIENAQIVNGLQTSETVYKYITESAPENEERSILVKILALDDDVLRNDIIYASNNQTNVDVAALRATDKLQKDIEEVLRRHNIYYERRTNFYKNQGISENDIVTPLSLAAGYINLIYKNPLTATSLKQKFMRDGDKYEKVFSSKVDINVWYPIAFLLKKTDTYLNELRVHTKPATQTNFLKRFRQILMLITVSRMLGTYAFNESHLIKFNLDSYTKEEVEKTFSDIQEIDEKCFERNKKLNTSFYKNCFEYMATKYGIKAIGSISSKQKKLWPAINVIQKAKLSEALISDVLKELPKQPWPVGIHKQIAEKLNQSELMVSNAIAYLIYTGKANAQIYGYVFDESGNVIAEGEHGKHSLEEARQKLTKQRRFHISKFDFNESNE